MNNTTEAYANSNNFTSSPANHLFFDQTFTTFSFLSLASLASLYGGGGA